MYLLRKIKPGDIPSGAKTNSNITMNQIRTNLTVQEACDKIRAAAQKQRLVLFIGAGVSRNAGYPDWKTLLDPAAQELGGWDDLAGQSLPQVAQTFENHHNSRAPLRRLLRQQLALQKEPSAVHLLLPTLQPALIVTTNYDNLLQKTFPAARLVASPGVAGDLARDELGIVHLHGHLDFWETGHDGLIITADDYMKVGKLKAPYFERLRAYWQDSLILFLGYGAGDWDVGQASHTVRTLYGEHYAQRHLALDLSGRKEAALRTFWNPFCADVVTGAELAGAHAGEKMLAFLQICAGTPITTPAPQPVAVPAPSPSSPPVATGGPVEQGLPCLPGLEMQSDRYGHYMDWKIKGVVQRLRYIPPGEFLMGSPAKEYQRADDEGPQHQVRISQGFWLADTACTQELWEALMGTNPSHFHAQNKGGLQHPVEQVSWHDVQGFLLKLNEILLPEWQASLPTEAEWEYACRAGTLTPFFFGEDISPKLVNYDGSHPYAKNGDKGLYRKCTVLVKELPLNAWGLYQMHGNVWEWCLDGRRKYTKQRVNDPGLVLNGEPLDAPSLRAARGGGWIASAGRARAAGRCGDWAGSANDSLGFRFALRSSSNKPGG